MVGIGFCFRFIRMLSVPFWLANTGGSWKAFWAPAVPAPPAKTTARLAAPIHRCIDKGAPGKRPIETMQVFGFRDMGLLPTNSHDDAGYADVSTQDSSRATLQSLRGDGQTISTPAWTRSLAARWKLVRSRDEKLG